MVKRIFTLLLATLLFCVPSHANDQKQPTCLTTRLEPMQSVDTLDLPPVDNARALESRTGGKAPGTPLQFAEPLAVNVDPGTPRKNQKVGNWETVAGGEYVWRLRVESPGALSLNFGFTRYHMPPGGRLYIYTPDLTDVIGPFTENDNESHGRLWTPIIPGDGAVIEVSVPQDNIDELELELGRVNHGFTGFGKPAIVKSGSCNVDVVCPEGDDWRDQIRSVGVYTLFGRFACSGALVNNTDRDGTPYFLTAHHCGVDSGNASSVVVYWNYQTSTCGGERDGSLDQFNTGATFKAGSFTHDMTLVELDDSLNPAHRLFLSGWDNTGADPDSAVTIHHPNTDEKSISFEYDPLVSLDTIVPYEDVFQVTDWDIGTTEPGSSGAPLFDPNHRIIGQLIGGYAACGNDQPDFYAKVSGSWTGDGTPESRLSDWLDPTGVGVSFLDGMNAAVDNDYFQEADELTGPSGQITGTNNNASKEPDEPDHAGDSGGKSIWWTWTAPDNLLVDLDTHGSAFDTLLAVYQGTNLADLVSVAENDDDGSENKNSGLDFQATGGESYYFAVDGYRGASGDVILNWDSCSPNIYYRDMDGDGYGHADNTIQACVMPDGYVADNTDCDDNNALIFPGAEERDNGLDDNCNGIIDEGFARFLLSVVKSGDGTGRVTGEPAGIDCGTVCGRYVDKGEEIILSAAPEAGSAFDEWSTIPDESETACLGNGALKITMDRDYSVTAVFNPDGDGDGVGDIVENAGPNQGDGNGDGILDAVQSHVAGFVNTDCRYVVLAADEGTTLKNVTATPNPSPEDTPEDLKFPYDFYGFSLQGLSPGDPAVVSLTLTPSDPSLNTYYRYGPTSDNPDDHWYKFDYFDHIGADINHHSDRTVIDLHFVDGLLGDDDLTANGAIVDPGGPASKPAESTGGGGGGSGCFIETGFDG